MSVSYIPEQVKLRLWGKAAGCCQYENCSKPLYIDQLVKAEFNLSYIAHIYADQKGGPRYDADLSPKLKSDITNLMLLCDAHHRLIDKAQVREHPASRLIAMKEVHERRMAIVSQVQPSKASHIILYGANIGNHQSPLSYLEGAHAMMPEHLPAQNYAIELGMKNASQIDSDPHYWDIESTHLKKSFNRQVAALKGNDPVQHFSVFALAPQPLLILLGSLLSDIYGTQVYQRHREPASWQWQPHSTDMHKFTIEMPADTTGVPVLVFEMSATIDNGRVTNVIKENSSVWKVKIESPHNNFLKTREQLSSFRTVCRQALDQIKAVHGENTELHVFPAMPVSAAVELGRVWMPKADLPMIVYDQNRISGGFIKTITIKNELLCYQ